MSLLDQFNLTPNPSKQSGLFLCPTCSCLVKRPKQAGDPHLPDRALWPIRVGEDDGRANDPLYVASHPEEYDAEYRLCYGQPVLERH